MRRERGRESGRAHLDVALQRRVLRRVLCTHEPVCPHRPLDLALRVERGGGLPELEREPCAPQQLANLILAGAVAHGACPLTRCSVLSRSGKPSK